jgi:hypothetical protein
VPELLARTVFAVFPALADVEMLILVNAAVGYFGAYFAFAFSWKRLKRYLGNPFLAGLVLWLVNVLVVFPVLGRGALGYRMPQGWMSASIPLLLSHWLFARGLQFQDKRS